MGWSAGWPSRHAGFVQKNVLRVKVLIPGLQRPDLLAHKVIRTQIIDAGNECRWLLVHKAITGDSMKKCAALVGKPAIRRSGSDTVGRHHRVGLFFLRRLKRLESVYGLIDPQTACSPTWAWMAHSSARPESATAIMWNGSGSSCGSLRNSRKRKMPPHELGAKNSCAEPGGRFRYRTLR